MNRQKKLNARIVNFSRKHNVCCNHPRRKPSVWVADAERILVCVPHLEGGGSDALSRTCVRARLSSAEGFD